MMIKLVVDEPNTLSLRVNSGVPTPIPNRPYIEYFDDNKTAKLHLDGDIPRYFSGQTVLTTVDLSDWHIGDTVGNYAFDGCSKLKNITLPNGVTRIMHYAFRGCKALNWTALPDSIETIGVGAFSGCTALRLSRLPSGFDGNIREYAFEDCSNIAFSELPNTTTLIPKNAFKGCFRLQLTTLPPVLLTVGESAFEGAYGIRLTDIPNSLKTIGARGFAKCTYLSSLRFYSRCNIASDAFDGCRNLTDIYVPWSAGDELSADAPWGATNATVHYDEIPSPTEEREYDDDNNLISIKLINYASIPAHFLENEEHLSLIDMTQSPDIEIIGDNAFAGCVNAQFVSEAGALGGYGLPQNVRSIGNNAFRGCRNLSLGFFVDNLPSTLETIGDYAFYQCSQLSPLKITPNVQRIGKYAFAETATFRISIRAATVDYGAFCDCPQLVEAWFGSEVQSIIAPSAVNSIFPGCPDGLEISAYAREKPVMWGNYFNRTGVNGAVTAQTTWGVTNDPIYS